jgi:glycosyltransferase involved in cell wall biosynthesis
MLSQTFRDFEILIINDASQDATEEILESYTDSRIRILKNAQPLGLAKSLNAGIARATGEFVARMDHDDVSLPLRLEKQVNYLEHDPITDLVGTWARTNGLPREQIWKYPSKHEEIFSDMLFNSSLVHSSVMWRRTRFDELGLQYSEAVARAQDYELWTRSAAKGAKFANLPEILLLYRVHELQSGNRFGSQQAEVADSVRRGQVENLGIRPSDNELRIHLECARWKFPHTIDGLRDLEAWLLKLKNANNQVRVYDDQALSRTLGSRWWEACRSNVRLGREAWRLYSSSLLSETGHNLIGKFFFISKAYLYGTPLYPAM